MNETLKQVIATLNQITVSGEANMDKLLGCIWTLKKLMNPEEAKNDG